MSSQSSAVPQSAIGSQAGICHEVSDARRMYWLLKRELWENRAIYVAPLVVAGVFLFGFVVSVNHVLRDIRATAGATTLDLQGEMFMSRTYDMAALAMMATTLIVAVFYCLDALHGERRDRSILFWKSLPVSDTAAVLSKVLVAIVLIPLVTWLITVALHVVMLVVSGAVLLASGQSLALLAHLGLGGRWIALVYHLVVVHGLWYAPFFAWFLLVSVWARRAPFLWAVLPPLAVGVLEKVLFNTSYFASLLESRFSGSPQANSHTAMSPFAMIADNPGFSSPGLWIGLALAAVFIFAAIRLRRHQGGI